MAAQQGIAASPLRALEEALGMDLTARDAADVVATQGTYYLEQVTIAEASEDECEYEEIPDDNFSIPEGEEDLTKAMQMAQEWLTDTQILEQKIVLPSKPVVPEAIEDFLCNFLIRMGMTRTLDCFQSEWYELMQKGVTELKDAGNVPDVYTQLMQLETERQNLKKQLKQYKQATDKAREDLLKTQKERDFHRMHHRRVIQEKNKLINDLKGLKLHYASYEPTMRVLLEKHQTLLKQKMLTSLERDRAVAHVKRLSEISGFQATTMNKGPKRSCQVPKCRVAPGYEKESAPEGHTQKVLPEAREQTKCKRNMKDLAKPSEGSDHMSPMDVASLFPRCGLSVGLPPLLPLPPRVFRHRNCWHWPAAAVTAASSSPQQVGLQALPGLCTPASAPPLQAGLPSGTEAPSLGRSLPHLHGQDCRQDCFARCLQLRPTPSFCPCGWDLALHPPPAHRQALMSVGVAM
ncbi:sperm-associated antigen 16 protein [Rhynchonycteris naso]